MSLWGYAPPQGVVSGSGTIPGPGVDTTAWHYGGDTVGSEQSLGTLDGFDVPLLRGGTEIARLTATEFIVNQGGLDVDFRCRADDNSYPLAVDAGLAGGRVLVADGRNTSGGSVLTHVGLGFEGYPTTGWTAEAGPISRFYLGGAEYINRTAARQQFLTPILAPTIWGDGSALQRIVHRSGGGWSFYGGVGSIELLRVDYFGAPPGVTVNPANGNYDFVAKTDAGNVGLQVDADFETGAGRVLLHDTNWRIHRDQMLASLDPSVETTFDGPPHRYVAARDGGPVGFTSVVHSNTVTETATLKTYKGRGTFAAKVAVTASDLLGQWEAYGWNGTIYDPAARLQVTTGAISAGNVAGRFDWYGTTTAGADVRLMWAGWVSDQEVAINPDGADVDFKVYSDDGSLLLATDAGADSTVGRLTLHDSEYTITADQIYVGLAPTDVGLANPFWRVVIGNEGAGQAYTGVVHSNTADNNAGLSFWKGRGTFASKAAVVNGDILSRASYYGYHGGGDYTESARMNVITSGVAAAALGTRYDFWAKTQTTALERLFWIGNSTGLEVAVNPDFGDVDFLAYSDDGSTMISCDAGADTGAGHVIFYKEIDQTSLFDFGGRTVDIQADVQAGVACFGSRGGNGLGFFAGLAAQGSITTPADLAASATAAACSLIGYGYRNSAYRDLGNLSIYPRATNGASEWDAEVAINVGTGGTIERLLSLRGGTTKQVVVNGDNLDCDFIVVADSGATLFATDGSLGGLALFGATPVVQPSGTGETVGFTAGAGTGVNDDSTFTGNIGATAYRISDIVKALKQLGALAA